MPDVCKAPAAADALLEEERFQALSSGEAKIVEAAASRIFPTTDTPGAAEAGVVHYIDRTLKEIYPKQIASYREGCAALERNAKETFGRQFTELAPDQQDKILSAFEKGTASGLADASEFFALLRKHTMEGMFCEPMYGGNRGLVGWRLVGFPGQQFGYEDPYINRVVDLEPIAHEMPFSQQEALDGRKS